MLWRWKSVRFLVALKRTFASHWLTGFTFHAHTHGWSPHARSHTHTHAHAHNTHTHTHRKARQKQRMLTQSSCVWRGWYRLVFSLHSSLTLTHSLASTLSQTCWIAAFAWRCHSSPCGSDVRRKNKTKKATKKKPPQGSHKECLHFFQRVPLLIFPPFYFLCCCVSVVWHLSGRKCLELQ